jgi:hypothetical protein
MFKRYISHSINLDQLVAGVQRMNAEKWGGITDWCIAHDGIALAYAVITPSFKFEKLWIANEEGEVRTIRKETDGSMLGKTISGRAGGFTPVEAEISCLILSRGDFPLIFQEAFDTAWKEAPQTA